MCAFHSWSDGHEEQELEDFAKYQHFQKKALRACNLSSQIFRTKASSGNLFYVVMRKINWQRQNIELKYSSLK